MVQKTGCLACHQGENFSGPKLPEGTPFLMKFPTFTDNDYIKKYKFDEDKGRFESTKKSEDTHFWRVPTWRNVALNAPYFHNGSVKDLNEAVRVMAKVQLNVVLAEKDVEDVVAFLFSLTGIKPKITMPVLPPTLGTSFF